MWDRAFSFYTTSVDSIIAGGADVGTVAALMGHTSLVMVLKHYQHVLNEQKRDAALPPLPGCVQIDVCKQ